MNPVDLLRRGWQNLTGENDTPFDHDTGGFLASLFLHLAVLVTLTLMSLDRPRQQAEITLSTSEPDEELIQQVEEASASDRLADTIGAASEAFTVAALAAAPALDDLAHVPDQITPADDPIEFVDMDFELPAGPVLSQDLPVKGATGVGATGADGAIDRITEEILLSLEERPTLVVWLFDRSISMQQQRDQINARFDRIYRELGLLVVDKDAAPKRASGKPLLTSIMSFGEKVEFRTKKPTADLDEIHAAIEEIDTDPSGTENTFTAIGMAAEKYQEYCHLPPRRNVMLVAVTDEAGDDADRLEDALALCRRHIMPVYVVGVPAPFGRTESIVKFVDPDEKFDQSPRFLPMHQGPESALQEQVALAFASPQGLEDLDRLDSGFGPFALTRMCYETGGIYFAVHPQKTDKARVVRTSETPVMFARFTHFFDPTIMRGYRPNYVSAAEYQQMLQANKACAALVQAAQLAGVKPMERPQTRFPKRDEGELKRLLDEAQKAAAKIEPKIDGVFTVLKAGAADRPKIASPRWRAGFDLAMGRVLALKVRTESYNAILAQMKAGRKFNSEDSDTWVLRPSDTVDISTVLEKMARDARTYLKRVVDEHPGTPWAVLAERELATPLGWEWDETHTGVNDPRPQRPAAVAGNGGQAQPRPQPPNRLPKPKPQRTDFNL